ncbi:hypothetical protein AGLY_006989 [Aphis glycines]|uniref:Uncharacterized protein n=1 Tax=Aphis glycines TaxID=307491 RepID=A0A6G0TPB9_APHGL|nr:hypothetical protein AGLY_006989 [Aphis glycines]
MKSLKAKLIIQIITFILIFGDAYADDDNAANDDGVKNVVNLFNNYIYSSGFAEPDIEKKMLDWLEVDLSTIIDIFKRKEDKKPTETTDNPEAVKIEIPTETIVNQDKNSKSPDSPTISATEIGDTEHKTPTKSIENLELFQRGYVYKNALLKAYIDYLRNEKLKADNTDDKQNISTDEKESISIDEQQSISNGEDTSTNPSYLDTVKKLYLNSWCHKNASSMIGYSDERKKRFKRVFENRAKDLNQALYACVLKADGFIQENAEKSYAFIEIETHFLTPYNEYLETEARKCQNSNPIQQLNVLAEEYYEKYKIKIITKEPEVKNNKDYL